jgi:flagellar basal-body rod protein FlgG
MIQGLYTAASGMAAHQLRIDVLANNLANVDTPGFKADLVTIDQSVIPENLTSDILAPLSTVEVGRPGMNLAPGALKNTGNPLDLAIIGPGLFVVDTPQGERYTRAGNFVRDAEGFLATQDGFRVLGSDGPVAVPEAGFHVDANGRVAGGGSLRVVGSERLEGLVKVGATLFGPAEGAPAPGELTDATVTQGQLEGSNVNVVMGMVEMLATMRTYEAYQKTIQALDQTVGQAANDLGRA